jgi:hypothetical protein
MALIRIGDMLLDTIADAELIDEMFSKDADE